MTLRLILTRHAKSDWDDPLQSDHQRGLNPRGQRAAPLIGRWLADRGYLPQAALVSDATRTQQTWALLSAELPQTVPVRFEPALYHASPDTILQVLRNAEAQTVIMIGHNPGIAAFADLILRAKPAHADFPRYPTCATLIAEFPGPHWADITPGTAKLRDFIVPRDLE